MLKNKKTRQNRLTIAGFALLTAVAFGLMLVSNTTMVKSSEADEFTYLPAIMHIVPTPTPLPPVFANNIELPGAYCPNDIGVNEQSGYVYVANSYSNNVSMIFQDNFVGNVQIGKLPTDIVSIPNSNRTYITHLTDTQGVEQITIFDQAALVDRLPDHFEPHDIIYNPVNEYIYVTDLDSTVRVIKGTGPNPEIVDVHLAGAGWVRSIEVDPLTGLVYAPSWENGIVYVIDGTTLVTQFQAGWGTMEISLEPTSGYFYLAHSNPSTTYPQNISVFHRDDYTVTPHFTAVRSLDVATDPIHHLAYATNRKDNSVTVLSGRNVVATLPVGEAPTPVTVDPTTGYAYVGNHDSNTVTILQNGSVISTQPAGRQPYAIAVNSQTHDVFVANRTWHIECDDLDRCNAICDEFVATVTVLR
ncbi:MAG: hypothetical protein CL608_04955 [Anaerolineaceae bacterium]|nr:hypothetical protein [Anaerolineaceae bacterium]